MDFIRLENSFEAAMSYKGSPQESDATSRYGIVQLLPNQGPYIQRTFAAEGLELESYVVRIKEVCGDNVYTIDSFQILNVFQDEDTGLNQIYWQLNDLIYDFGESLVYLEIERNGASLNNFLYSSPFYLTSEGKDFTSRWDYRDEPTDIMMSTQLRIFYRQPIPEQTLSTYDTVSGSRRATQNSKLLKFELWKTDTAPFNDLERISGMLNVQFKYCDFERTTLAEPFEIPRAEFDENFGESELLLQRDRFDTFNPLSDNVNPLPKTITLNSMTGVTDLQFYGAVTNVVTYTFQISGFVPEKLRYQRSLNPEANQWTTFESLVIGSPFQLGVPDWVYNDYWYRIFAPVEGIISNQLQIARIFLDRIAWGNGDMPRYIYSYSGFIASSLTFQYSTDGVNWTNLLSNDVDGGTNPGVVPNFETTNYKYRIWHQSTDTYSNERTYAGFELQVTNFVDNGEEVTIYSDQHGYGSQDFQVLYQYSINGLDWRGNTQAKYENVATFKVAPEYKLVRIYEPINNVSSNIVQLKR